MDAPQTDHRQALSQLDPEQLMRLELEVVSLQQTLQAALLDHQSRSAQIHRLQQALHEAEDRAEASDRRSLELAEQVLVSEERASAAARQLQASEAQLASQQESLGAGRRRVAAAEARTTEVCVQLASCQHRLRAAEARCRATLASLAEAHCELERRNGAGEGGGVATPEPHSAQGCGEGCGAAAPACFSAADLPPLEHALQPSPLVGAGQAAGGLAAAPFPGTPSPRAGAAGPSPLRRASPAQAPAVAAHWPDQLPHVVTSGGPREVVLLGAPVPAQGAKKAARQWVAAPKYGQDPLFREVKAAYNTAMEGAGGSASDRWVQRVFSQPIAVVSDPQKVEPVVEGLTQLCEEAGMPLPLARLGPCQYALGGCKLTVRLVRGRLMVRSGAGHLPLLDWVEKQAVPKAG